MSRALRFIPLHRPWVVWLAVLLALFGALAPTVSHALVSARGDTSPWLEICSSTGTRSLVPSTPANSPADDESSSLREACTFCLLNAERAAPPPTDQVRQLAANRQCGAPAFWQTDVVTSPLGLAAQPRGPPTLITLFFAA